MVDRKQYSWDDVHKAAHKIAMKMYNDKWRPDYIVGLNRGGLPISVILSHLLDCNHYALDVRLRDNKDGEGPESNCWMAEDAFGYVSEFDRDGIFEKNTSDVEKKKNILIVDDINDTGTTLIGIDEVIKGSQRADMATAHQDITYSTLFDKESSKFSNVRFTANNVLPDEEKWIVFPYEEWWK